MNDYDAIVIGAGHNGLTNATYLAKAGLNVVLLEKNDFVGGAAVTREFQEGWKYSRYSYVCSTMRQAVHRDLDLGKHGLLIVPYLGTVNFGDGDERLFAYHNEQALHLELKRHSPRDADAMHRFQIGENAFFAHVAVHPMPPGVRLGGGRRGLKTLL